MCSASEAQGPYLLEGKWLENVPKYLLCFAPIGQMSDQELKEWQQMQINKCRIENICNKVTEIHRYVQALHSGQDVAEQSNLELEESAILMAIGSYGLVGTSDAVDGPQNCTSFRYCDSSENLNICSSLTYQQLAQEWEPWSNMSSSASADSAYEIHDEPSKVHLTTPLPDNFETNPIISHEQEHQQFVETAVSAAIQKQGLGILELKR